MEAVNSKENHSEVDRLKIIEDILRKTQSDLKICAFEISEIKNNLVLISEMVTKLANIENVQVINAKTNFSIFGKFVEESLENLTKHQAEAVVLEIVEILHKYKSKNEEVQVN